MESPKKYLLFDRLIATQKLCQWASFLKGYIFYNGSITKVSIYFDLTKSNALNV
jgi:hypothetical protein